MRDFAYTGCAARALLRERGIIMRIEASSVAEYLDQVPDDRKERLTALHALIREKLPDSRETIAHGMPTYMRGGDVAVAFASQKQHISVYFPGYLFDRYPELAAGQDCGKGCLRFRKAATMDFAVIGALLDKVAARS
jgi:uncharacterized protein YdhG (YjbR/CyaY superfamily)